MEKYLFNNVTETKNFAKKFAQNLKGGEIILIKGDLGTGKTTFTTALCRELGVKDGVSSPTFTIQKNYTTKKFDIFHFDMYRIGSVEELIDLGVEDIIYNLTNNQIIIIEWPELVKKLIKKQCININIKYIEENKREFSIDYFD